MNRIFSLLILSVFIFSACGDKPDQVTSIKKEVMDVHDELMPKMGELRNVRKTLITKAQAADSSMASELETLAQDLEAANESMMDWMNQYEPQFEGTEKDQVKYYSDQRTSIQTVKERMLNALEKGQKALDE